MSRGRGAGVPARRAAGGFRVAELAGDARRLTAPRGAGRLRGCDVAEADDRRGRVIGTCVRSTVQRDAVRNARTAECERAPCGGRNDPQGA